MRAREIAENIVNGNISTARIKLQSGRSREYAMTRLLDVVEELVDLLPEHRHFYTPDEAWVVAVVQVRRCLTGGT